MRLSPRLHYAWLVAAASFALMVNNGLVFWIFGVFIKPLEAEFGWGRALTSSAYGFMNLAYALSGFLVGRLSDRYGPRLILLFCGLLAGSAFILLSQTQSIGQFRFLYLLIGLGSGSIWGLPLATVQRWFLKRQSLMLSLTATGGVIGGMTFNPLANLSISLYGWRTTFVLVGLLFLATHLFGALALFHSPEKRGLRPYGAEEHAGANPSSAATTLGLSTSQAIRTRAFFGLLAIFILVTLPGQIVLVHLVPFAIDKGIAPSLAAGAIGLVAGFSALGRVLISFMVGKIGWKRAMGLACFVASATFLWLSQTGNLPMLYIFVVIYGLAHGAKVLSQVGCVSSFFGTRSLAELLGIYDGVALALGGSLGPFLAGLVFDKLGSYSPVFLLAALSYVGAGVLALRLTPPKR